MLCILSAISTIPDVQYSQSFHDLHSNSGGYPVPEVVSSVSYVEHLHNFEDSNVDNVIPSPSPEIIYSNESMLQNMINLLYHKKTQLLVYFDKDIFEIFS